MEGASLSKPQFNNHCQSDVTLWINDFQNGVQSSCSLFSKRCLFSGHLDSTLTLFFMTQVSSNEKELFAITFPRIKVSKRPILGILSRHSLWDYHRLRATHGQGDTATSWSQNRRFGIWYIELSLCRVSNRLQCAWFVSSIPSKSMERTRKGNYQIYAQCYIFICHFSFYFELL